MLDAESLIGCVLVQLLWRYNREAVTMRIQFLTEADRRVEACTVLVRDIPGIYYGTVADRIERTALRFLPSIVKRKIVVSCLLREKIIGLASARKQAVLSGKVTCLCHAPVCHLLEGGCKSSQAAGDN